MMTMMAAAMNSKSKIIIINTKIKAETKNINY